MMIDIILFLFTNLFFIEIQSNQHQQYRALRSFRLEKRSLAEFDVPHSTTPSTTIPTTSTEIDQQSLEEKVENKIARGYQIIGHSRSMLICTNRMWKKITCDLELSQLADQMENNREKITNKFGDFYSGPLADQTGSMYENVQYGSGKFADAVSPFFSWLGRNVIDLGENSGTLLRKSFYSIGDFLGSTVDRTDHFIGDQLIKTAENMHQAGNIDDKLIEHQSHWLRRL